MRYILKEVEFKHLNESLSSARKAFVKTEKMDEEVFDKLTGIDPTNTKKYLEKICKFYLELKKGSPGMAIYMVLPIMGGAIRDYHNIVEKGFLSGDDKKYTDINQFENYKKFLEVVSSYRNVQSSTEMKKKMKQDAEVIRDDKDFFIVAPKTKEASCIFGSGTPWCTAYTGENKLNMFDDYYKNKDVKLYYILNKNLSASDIMRRTAVAVGPDGDFECFDMENDYRKPVPLKRILDMGLSKEIFVPKEVDFLKFIRGTYEVVDGVYNVTGSVNIQKWYKPFPIKFGTVTGYFDCSGNKMESLEGCPTIVKNFFDCGDNDLKSLEGGPKVVKGDFNCYNNKLKTLEGGPKEVGGSYQCYNNELESLKGSPVIVGRSFNCHDNKLITLEGGPKEVGVNFNCENNKLTDLKGAPESVDRNFYCNDNKLESLDGCPWSVGGNFVCNGNETKFTKEEVEELCDVGENIVV